MLVYIVYRSPWLAPTAPAAIRPLLRVKCHQSNVNLTLYSRRVAERRFHGALCPESKCRTLPSSNDAIHCPLNVQCNNAFTQWLTTLTTLTSDWLQQITETQIPQCWRSVATENQCSTTDRRLSITVQQAQMSDRRCYDACLPGTTDV